MLLEVETEKGRVLLFPILHVAQSKETNLEKPIEFNNPELTM